MRYDVIILGGSYAGMAAALQLVRARRSVLVIDAGEPRNRFASHAHGFLGQDGVPPGDIATGARRQLETYPSLTWLNGRADTIVGEFDQFTVTTTDGSSHQARRILLATGVSDSLPAIDGLAERWGRSVFHCPYCHGYELDQGHIGIIATGPLSLHQAELLTDWGKVSFLVNRATELTADVRTGLAHRGVVIEETAIDRIAGDADVILTDGRQLHFAGLFVVTRTAPSSPLAEALGCALEETPFGTQVRIDAENRTSVAGAFACGDLARAPHSVSLAVGNGAMAGAQVHRSLLWPDAFHPAKTDGSTR